MRKKNVNNSIIKQCITEALFLLMQSKDFNNISITELTEKAGVGRTSFYRNYSDKEGVIKEKLQYEASKWWKEFKLSGKTNYIEGLFEHIYDIKDILQLLYNQNLQNLMFESTNCIIGSSTSTDVWESYEKALFAASIYGITIEWVKRGMKETPEHMGMVCKTHHINASIFEIDVKGVEHILNTEK